MLPSRSLVRAVSVYFARVGGSTPGSALSSVVAVVNVETTSGLAVWETWWKAATCSEDGVVNLRTAGFGTSDWTSVKSVFAAPEADAGKPNVSAWGTVSTPSGSDRYRTPSGCRTAA